MLPHQAKMFRAAATLARRADALAAAHAREQLHARAARSEARAERARDRAAVERRSRASRGSTSNTDAEPSDAPYEVPAFQEKTEPIKDSDKKKWKAHNAQRKKEKKDLVPFEVWLANKKDQEERKKKARFVAMMGGAISAF